MCCLIFLFSLSSGANIESDLRALIKSKDDLGLRIYIKKIAHADLSLSLKNNIRTAIYNNPNVGYDLIQKWEHFTIPELLKNSNQDETEINRLSNLGHENFEKKSFAQAFEYYQNAAKRITKIYSRNLPKYQEHFYNILIHQMARCLYSLGKFNEALEVYQWIPRSYYHFRQVLFEKMWAAFRASRIDAALGAMASQQSAYFSRYLEPEAYLLRIYLLKRLCRDDEIKRTIAEVTTYMNLINDNKYKMHEWAKADIDSIVLLSLINKPPEKIELLKYASVAERVAEKRQIESQLTSRFNAEKERLAASLKKVIGYSKIISMGSDKKLTEIKNLPDSKVLSATGKELWMSNDGEEWSDELGSHFYVGESKCKK
jgi:hypothetical protein